MLLVRSLSFATLTVLAWSAGCSAPDRTFAPGDASTTTDTSTSPGAGGGSTVSSSSHTAPGAGGGDGDGGEGGSDTSTGGTTQTGGGGAYCGDGALDEGEECDDTSSLCNQADCTRDCPDGWFLVGEDCFAVALNPVNTPLDGLTGDAVCGALHTRSSGFRPHAATPDSFDELFAIASRAPTFGAWLGFYSLGAPGDFAFLGPTTGESLLLEEWAKGEPSSGAEDVCVTASPDENGDPILAARPCSDLAFFTCQIERSYGSFATCGDGVVDEGEECDGGDSCSVDCDRECGDGWIEDPRTHACYRVLEEPGSWSQSLIACQDVGGRLATPDEVADLRIASAVATDSVWIGLEVAPVGAPSGASWISDEPFDFVLGAYPFPETSAPAGCGLLTDGEIFFEDPGVKHLALCERLDPDD